jgi:glycyl-tRNA synthetase beta subunit
MALYERLLGRDDNGVKVEGKIPIHQFQAVLAERARGMLTTNAAARDVINSIITNRGGQPLSPAEETEAVTLLTTITSLANATAKLARAKEIDDVLMLGDFGPAGYVTPTQIKARLGV